MREPTWSEVDGVPVAWLPLPGPIRAVLSFRVGVANETAALHGITHLVEHLALHGMHDRPYALNGAVDLTRATFVAAGRPEEITDFLGTVCRRLGDLPAERVEVERGILRAEADSRSTSYRDGLLYWRYGAQAHGLAGLAEYGLNWAGADTVRWWAAQRFTRQNAFLVLTGEPPAGLRLPLADGLEQPPLVARPVEEVIPGWTAVPAAGFAMGATAARAVATPVAVATIEHELSRVLRFERGITYSVAAEYEPVDAATAHAVFSADAAEERHGELRDAFLGVVEHLARYGPPEEVVARLHDMRSRADADELAGGFLTSLGRDFALGRPYESFDDIEARQRAVAAADVHAVVREIADAALYLVPAPHELPADRYPPLPVFSPGTVAGEVHRGVHGTLVVGPEGVSAVHEGNAATVRWSDAVATLWWQDGARTVVGRDGFRVSVVPADWENGAVAVARIDQLAPRQTMVPMPGEGPRPAATQPTVPPPRWRPMNPVLAWVGNVALYLFALLMAIGAAEGPEPATATAAEVTAGDVAFMAVLAVVLLAANVWWTVQLVRRRPQRGEPA